MITYPITLPSAPTQRAITLRPRAAVSVAQSPFSLKQQVYAWGGQLWEGDLQLPPMSRAQAAPWVAALTSLNQSQGTFYLGDRVGRTAQGTATGTPLVKGGSQTGYDLITDGWTAGVSTILKAGDWLSLGSGADTRLHMVMADAASNGSGESTLTLWPALRTSPADNAAIDISAPVGVFRLAANFQFSIDDLLLYGIGFSFVEAL
jgi:hypothetical protein